MRSPLIVVVITLLCLSCASVPSETDVKVAGGHRDVALALVHEAEKASTAGDRQTQDLKLREALRELLTAEKTGGMDSEGRYLLAYVYFIGFARHSEALAQLALAIAQRSKERDEEFPEAENLVGTVLLEAGRPNEALPHFDKARTNLLYATPYFAELGMGGALFRLGRHDEAAQHLERALVAQPDLCGAYVKLAEVEIVRGDDARVQTVLNDFLARCDSDRLRESTGKQLLSAAHLELGKSRLRTGARDEALEAFKRCVTRFTGEAAANECDVQLRVLDSGG